MSCVSSISEPIELNGRNRTQSNIIQWTEFDCVRLNKGHACCVVWLPARSLYASSGKPTHKESQPKTRFSRPFFFYWLFNKKSQLSTAVKRTNLNKAIVIPANSSRWRWPKCQHSFTTQKARPFSPIFFKLWNLRPPSRQRGTLGSLLLRS